MPGGLADGTIQRPPGDFGAVPPRPPLAAAFADLELPEEWCPFEMPLPEGAAVPDAPPPAAVADRLAREFSKLDMNKAKQAEADSFETVSYLARVGANSPGLLGPIQDMLKKMDVFKRSCSWRCSSRSGSRTLHRFRGSSISCASNSCRWQQHLLAGLDGRDSFPVADE